MRHRQQMKIGSLFSPLFAGHKPKNCILQPTCSKQTAQKPASFGCKKRTLFCLNHQKHDGNGKNWENRGKKTLQMRIDGFETIKQKWIGCVRMAPNPPNKNQTNFIFVTDLPVVKINFSSKTAIRVFFSPSRSRPTTG